MTNIELIKPEKNHRNIIADFINEHKDSGEFEIHGGALVEKMEYEDWLQQLADNSDKSTVKENWVIASTFLVMRKSDNKMIAMLDIRHELNDFLKSYGGHIGLGIRPTERGKGYGNEITKMALVFCKKIGLQKVMFACFKDNFVSRKVIESCGGILEKEIMLSEIKNFPFCNVECGERIVQIFWISL
jgi:predicted acetyltransferase